MSPYPTQRQVKLPLGSNRLYMNKKNIISFVAAAVCLSSCFVDEKMAPDVVDAGIWYNLAPVKEVVQTKAIQEYAGSFGSYAFLFPTGMSYDTDKKDASVSEYIHNAKIEKVGGVWKCASQMYSWPTGGSLTFFSYAPYELSLHAGFSCTAADGIQITDYVLPVTVGNTATEDDILIADIAKDLTSNVNPGAYFTKGVPTLFRHKLSKVSIQARLNNELEDGEYVKITSIQLFNIYMGGDFDGTKWINLDNKADFAEITLTGDNGNLTLDSKTLFAPTLMMPQPTSASGRPDAPKIRVVYETEISGTTKTTDTELNLYNGPASLAAWEMGKEVIYNISISTKDEYIEFDASYNNWTEVEMDPDINVGL